MNRFSVVSMHFTRECNLDCPFCYRPKGKTGNEKPFMFFIDCVKYIKEIAPQIALGGGEPFLFPAFIKDLGAECKKQGVMLNITTNGRTARSMDGPLLHDTLRDVTMTSVSLDHAKWYNLQDYASATRRIESANPGMLVGTNLLLEPVLFEEKGKPLFDTIQYCLKQARVDRVFLLYPKNIPIGVNIIDYKGLLSAISTVFPGRIFTDDLTRQILEHGYPPWDVPCHFGKDIVSIDEEGGVHGCSFDTVPVLKLANAQDILQLKDMQFGNRMSCPYLKR
jgi:organic radical activating enzyme